MAYTKNVREIVEQIRMADEEEFGQLLAEYGEDPRAGVSKALDAAQKRIDKTRAEKDRVEQMYGAMREAGEGKVIVGVDEVGRGSLAGPLTVAAVVLPDDPIVEGLNDSKQMTPRQRESVSETIRQRAVAIGMVHIPPADIDRDGMSVSLKKAMSLAIEGIGLDADVVFIDGNPVHVHPKETCIVHGDGKVACIAAASIVAKVARDELMVEADSRYPGYGFAKNKGYGSQQHIDAIRELGLCEIHRRSFCTSFLQQSLF